MIPPSPGVEVSPHPQMTSPFAGSIQNMMHTMQQQQQQQPQPQIDNPAFKSGSALLANPNAHLPSLPSHSNVVTSGQAQMPAAWPHMTHAQQQMFISHLHKQQQAAAASANMTSQATVVPPPVSFQTKPQFKKLLHLPGVIY